MSTKKTPKPKEEALYKIFNPKTQKYSLGGTSPSWNGAGKAWSSLGTLNSHLAQFYLDTGELCSDYPYKDCEIVKVKVVHEFTERIDADMHIAALRLRRLAQNDTYRARLIRNVQREGKL